MFVLAAILVGLGVPAADTFGGTKVPLYVFAGLMMGIACAMFIVTVVSATRRARRR